MTKTLVIIGTGLAGYHLAKEFRKIDKTQKLILITQDDGHFYSKPQLSIAFSQKKSPDALIIHSVTEMQKQLDATIFTSTIAKSIDIALQCVVLQTPTGQKEIYYDQLVFAQGASPKPLLNLMHAHRINSLENYRTFMKGMPDWKALTIIGSGLVGCEFVHDFSKADLLIDVITQDPYPLYGLVPSLIGKQLQQVLSNARIHWHTQTALVGVEKEEPHLKLTLTNQQTIETDAILCAIGLLPNILLAQKAGIEVDKGIVVNNFLQTNYANVYALGDCAQINGVCRQYINPLMQSARALAQTLCGQFTPVVFGHFPISLKVASYPIVVLPPPSSIEGDWSFETDGQHVKALFFDTNNILQGYVLSGRFVEDRQRCLQSLGKTSEHISFA